MSLVGFMQAGNTSVYAGSWRHPATEHGFLTASYYQKLGRTLEEGCFDLMFFDDRLAMPGIYGGLGGRRRPHGARPVKLDLSVVLGVVAGATAAHRARRHVLDHLLLAVPRGPHLRHARPPLRRPRRLERRHVGERQRGAELRRRGASSATTQRYDRADEFLEATTGLWDTWDDDALVLDRANGVFADPDKVHELNYKGEWFKVRGPLTVPRGPQGRPVLLQAGSSGRGRDFASRWAEVIFTGDPDIDIARSHYKDQKERIGGRRARSRRR